MVSRAYELDTLVIRFEDDTARQETTPHILCLPIKNSLGIKHHLYLDEENARNYMLYIARWLITFNHDPSPLVLGWGEDIDKNIETVYSE